MKKRIKHKLKVIQLQKYNNTLYKLRITRGNISFHPGQHISLGFPGIGAREYSIASGVNDNFLEVIFRKIENGKISEKLSILKPGEYIEIGNPIGYFSIPENFVGNAKKKIYLVATGSGIAPFRCFSLSYPQNSFILLHGISHHSDNLQHDMQSNINYITCSRKLDACDYHDRVTSFLNKEISTDEDALFYLCGNGNMIYEAYRILTQKQIKAEKIYYEEYF